MPLLLTLTAPSVAPSCLASLGKDAGLVSFGATAVGTVADAEGGGSGTGKINRTAHAAARKGHGHGHGSRSRPTGLHSRGSNGS